MEVLDITLHISSLLVIDLARLMISKNCNSKGLIFSRIDTAHKHGIFVLMDLVHSHASSNESDGLGNWDCSDHHYFHAGSKGKHDLWDSKCFDYGKMR